MIMANSMREDNARIMEKICTKLGDGPCLVDYLVPAQNRSTIHSYKKPKLEENFSQTLCMSEENMVQSIDFPSIQRKLFQLESSNPDLVNGLELKDLISDQSLVAADDHVAQICYKSLSDSNLKTAIAKLIVYPKLHFSSVRTLDNMVKVLRETNFNRTNPAMIEVLCALISDDRKVPGLLEDCMLDCTASESVKILSACLDCTHSSESDISFIPVFVEHLSFTNKTVLGVFMKYVKVLGLQFSKSSKFGRNLLSFMKKVKVLPKADMETLQQIVEVHSSVMKRALEVQLKKIKN